MPLHLASFWPAQVEYRQACRPCQRQRSAWGSLRHSIIALACFLILYEHATRTNRAANFLQLGKTGYQGEQACAF